MKGTKNDLINGGHDIDEACESVENTFENSIKSVEEKKNLIISNILGNGSG